MEIKSLFYVSKGIDEAWSILTDIEGIAPCVPGFQLQEVEGDVYRGTMHVRVGAVTLGYESEVQFVERDDSSYRAVMRGGGREQRGQGTVDATITSQLTADSGERTQVDVTAALNVTGRIAGFGRGIMADVSQALVDQFARCLESRVIGGGS